MPDFIYIDEDAVQDIGQFLKAVDAADWFKQPLDPDQHLREEFRLYHTHGEHTLPGGLVCSARLGRVESCL